MADQFMHLSLCVFNISVSYMAVNFLLLVLKI